MNWIKRKLKRSNLRPLDEDSARYINVIGTTSEVYIKFPDTGDAFIDWAIQVLKIKKYQSLADTLGVEFEFNRPRH